LAGLLGSAALLLSGGRFALLAEAPPTAWVYALATGSVVLLVTSLGSRGHLALAGAAMAFAPALISLLDIVEAAVGVFGPRPLLVGPVFWAAVVGAAATLLLATTAKAGPVRRPLSGEISELALPVAALAAVGFALFAMTAPGVEAAVRGGFHEGGRFAADFVLPGWRTVGGWLTLGCAGVASAMTLRRSGRLEAAAGATVTLLIVAAWYTLRYTPLHTWMTWVPAEIQQDFGTEYASIVFSATPVPWQIAALGLSCATALLMLVKTLAEKRRSERER
jgi:hypothetical protein